VRILIERRPAVCVRPPSFADEIVQPRNTISIQKPPERSWQKIYYNREFLGCCAEKLRREIPMASENQSRTRRLPQPALPRREPRLNQPG
jgi:hypothetical protein